MTITLATVGLVVAAFAAGVIFGFVACFWTSL